jgi:hypothetical protein
MSRIRCDIRCISVSFRSFYQRILNRIYVYFAHQGNRSTTVGGYRFEKLDPNYHYWFPSDGQSATIMPVIPENEIQPFRVKKSNGFKKPICEGTVCESLEIAELESGDSNLKTLIKVLYS